MLERCRVYLLVYLLVFLLVYSAPQKPSLYTHSLPWYPFYLPFLPPLLHAHPTTLALDINRCILSVPRVFHFGKLQRRSSTKNFTSFRNFSSHTHTQSGKYFSVFFYLSAKTTRKQFARFIFSSSTRRARTQHKTIIIIHIRNLKLCDRQRGRASNGRWEIRARDFPLFNCYTEVASTHLGVNMGRICSKATG